MLCSHNFIPSPDSKFNGLFLVFLICGLRIHTFGSINYINRLRWRSDEVVKKYVDKKGRKRVYSPQGWNLDLSVCPNIFTCSHEHKKIIKDTNLFVSTEVRTHSLNMIVYIIIYLCVHLFICVFKHIYTYSYLYMYLYIYISNLWVSDLSCDHDVNDEANPIVGWSLIHIDTHIW